MSDPVKNAEVEDVLSSIRRLVTEDKRPLQAPKPALQNDRLVLTPALRVEDDVAPPMDVAKELEKVGDDEELSLVAENAAVADTRIDADAKDISDDYDDDPYSFDDEQDKGGDAKDGDANDALLLTDPAETQDLSETNAPAEDVDTPDTKAVTLSAKIAALETAIGDISDEWEPDRAGQDAYAGSEPEAMVWEDDLAVEEDVPEVSFSHHRDVAEQVEDRESEQVETSDADTKVAAEPVQDEGTADVTDDVAGFALSAEDQLLDEDTLREMISEIVQSELQGVLGERITRNVRRLVRREIHRALTARDLD